MIRNLRVAIDARPLVGERTGIGVHTAEIASRLEFDPPPLLASHAEIINREDIDHLGFRIDRSPLGVIWQQMVLPRVLETLHSEVLWGPHGTLPLRCPIPAVVSMHDLSSITTPFRHRFRTILAFNTFVRQSLEKAAFIAAVSGATADAVARGFGLARSRIEIVPNGVGEEFYRAASPALLPPGLEPGSYILFAGTMEPRKGIEDLIDAWEALPERPTLVLCGSKGWGLSRLRSRIAVLIEKGEILMPGFVSRETLIALEQHALIFVYPSRDEGFGLPPLEAMAAGTPVIATLAGAIPEITGDAALLVPPGNPSALAAAMRRLLGSSAAREDLVARGQQRARVFTWDRSARLMGELLLRAASRRH
ncbi:MAG TPA: glycosyltransferase family 1 protein [Thermoanaerobaculia bacterium]|nr:glycosyltransferase family 1 protein [Thermoanaerobaculia bacterium]